MVTMREAKPEVRSARMQEAREIGGVLQRMANGERLVNGGDVYVMVASGDVYTVFKGPGGGTVGAPLSVKDLFDIMERASWEFASR